MTNDPDLDQACEDLAYPAVRLRQLQEQVARIDPIKDYSTIVARRSDLADAEEEFRLRGERLAMHPTRHIAGRALLTVVEEVGRWRRAHRGRRPTAAQLALAVRTAVENAQRDLTEAEAEYNLARLGKVLATHRAASTTAALSYMEASR